MASSEMELRQRREGKEEVAKEGLRPRDAGPGGEQASRPTGEWVHAAVALVVVGIITYLTTPANLTAREPTPLHVWYYGWITALSTGLGAVPLLMWSKPSDFWLGASNAIAAGMMLSASFSLVPCRTAYTWLAREISPSPPCLACTELSSSTHLTSGLPNNFLNI